VSHTTFLVSKCLETGAEVSQSVLMPKCPVTFSTFQSCESIFSMKVLRRIRHRFIESGLIAFVNISK